MKRVFCLLLSVLVLLSLVGCLAVERTTEPAVDLTIVTRPAQTTAAESQPASTVPSPTVTEATASAEEPTTTAVEAAAPGLTVTEDGVYDSKDEVALYIHLYGHLPSNYITKKQAEALGWPGGSLEPYASGKCIGGSHFGNYEGLLPDAAGRTWTECDIDTRGAKSRGAKRIIFSNDGLIYYTDDHYEHFELLYGQED